ncbi:molybdate/tungstate ABC transport system permease protein ModB [Thermacetogenium phaeum DSM 12270]|uniref:Molybdenum transport system permease n=1 Tax=Thermacetogenium phaeum (strain ATCC BAA-254 / DSM 26808 / PB) TaxID=1089553 RepID=K4LXZ8_THEPS|nr:molybdate ABC transporter permease subunit [Thermacetogenium phaeum]AFV12809.1 molybdate/tungstate ABC transport system permease protein ModB [Thermacetogenium phaeum DSM 12270]MDK2881017.1 molybdate transport system permease protein [Clostridia bacterium]
MLDEKILIPALLSLRVAVLAVVLAFIAGVPVARLMAGRDFPGKEVVEAVLTLPLVLPPTVVGFGLLFLFGKHGPLGLLLEKLWGVSVVFNWWGAVVASTVVAFPLLYQTVRASFQSVDRNLENAARTLGAGEWRVFWTISLPLAWPGLVAGTVMAFARALGEFGATLMIAGNIPGRTQTVPLAIYAATESGENRIALVLVGIMTLLSFVFILGVNLWSRHRLKRWTIKEKLPRS